jgi:DNA polymerase III subunit epsilon
MAVIKIFYDLETTGLDYRKHSIHHLAGMVEINDEIVENFDFKVAPNPKAQIDSAALKIVGVTEDEIRLYPPMKEVFLKFISILNSYIDKYDTKQKAYLVGFNNRAFDDVFLRAWFDQNGSSFFTAWFWPDSLDSMVLASQYLINRRPKMPSFKLHRVAKELGIEVKDENLHDAKYDIELTRKIYRIVTGID